MKIGNFRVLRFSEGLEREGSKEISGLDKKEFDELIEI